MMSEFLNKLGIGVLTPNLLKLPFVHSIVSGGVYIPHPSEPPLWSRKPDRVNVLWIDWLQFVVQNSPDLGDNFNHKVHQYGVSDPRVPKIAMAIGHLIKIDLAKKDIVLPETPPPISTRNGRYLSHAWVLDIARRDNMPINEAVALGISLIHG